MSSYFEPALTTAQAAAIADIANGTTSVPVIRPSLAASVDVVSGVGAWVLGAWVQVVAANDLAKHMMIGMLWQRQGGGVANNVFDVEWGAGTAGNEVVFWRTIAYREVAAVDAWQFITFVPAPQVPANARVAVRCASPGVGADNGSVKGLFIPRPIA